jgi:hypothetical protein
MPLWWNLYHVVLAIPLLVCFWTWFEASSRARNELTIDGCSGSGSTGHALDRARRILAALLLGVAYCGLNAYAVIDHVLGQLAPGALESFPLWAQRAIAETVGYPATLALWVSLLLCAAIAGASLNRHEGSIVRRGAAKTA